MTHLRPPVTLVVPAAGRGTRLPEELRATPKCLLMVNGQSLLERTLALAEVCGIERAVIVAGYKSESVSTAAEAAIRRPRHLFVVINEHFATTNSIASLAASTPHWVGTICIVDSDVIFRRSLLARLLACTKPTLAIGVDLPSDEIDMGVGLSPQGTVSRLGKKLPRHAVAGDFFGMSVWHSESAVDLARHTAGLVAANEQDAWYESAIEAVARDRPLYALPVKRHEWAEIDTAKDLDSARARFADTRMNRPGERTF